MIWESEHEILNSDATRLHAAALAQGVQSEPHLAPGLPHVWPIMVSFPESKSALGKLAQFISRCAGENSCRHWRSRRAVCSCGRWSAKRRAPPNA